MTEKFGTSGCDADPKDDGLPKHHRPNTIADDWQAENSPPQFVAIHSLFDADKIRLTRQLRKSELQHICNNCKGGARLIPGNHSRYFIDEVLSMNQPEEPALQLVSELPGARINYLEPASEFILPANISSEDLHDLFNQFFVQSHHEKYRSNYRVRGTTSYSTENYVTGHSYRWYADRPSKISGEPNCFKWEGRHQGERAVHQIGVHHPKDLLTLDFEAYRNERLRLYKLDWERLKRYYHNRQTKSRLRKSSSIPVNDQRVTSWRRILYGLHPDWDVNGDVKRFVDLCGRGPFLTQITMLDLLELTQLHYIKIRDRHI